MQFNEIKSRRSSIAIPQLHGIGLNKEINHNELIIDPYYLSSPFQNFKDHNEQGYDQDFFDSN